MQSAIYYSNNKACQFSIDFETREVVKENWVLLKSGEKSTITFVRQSAEDVEEASAIIYRKCLKLEAEGWTTEKTSQIPLPQLAKVCPKNFSSFPCYSQPKIDGMRMISNGKTSFTRTGKVVIPEVIAHLNLPKFNDFWFDGELVLAKPYTFQQTISAIKKYSNLSPLLEFVIYDCFDKNQVHLSFEQRLKVLQDLGIKTLRTNLLQNSSELSAQHFENIAKGFEGTMIRTLENSQYKCGKRSAALLKLKDMITEEFTCIGVEPGKGKASFQGILILRTSEGQTFKAALADEASAREIALSSPNLYIGKQVTIRFQEYTDLKIPRFPVALTVRDYE